MSAKITGGINSIVVSIATPYEYDENGTIVVDVNGNKLIRDDFSGIMVWYSTSPEFNPLLQGVLAYNGPGLNVTIPIDSTDLTVNYYVRYALISDIDPTVLDISDPVKVNILGAGSLELTLPVIPTDPAVNKIVVTSGFSSIFVSEAQPNYTVGKGHLKTRVYGLNKTLYPTKEVKFDNATLQVDFSGTIGSFNSQAGTSWAVWVTWVSVDGGQVNPNRESLPVGPFTAATSSDVSQLVNAVLKGSDSPFKVVEAGYIENQGTLDQFYVPPGAYAKAAFITDGFITNAKIADGTIDSAKINSLDAIHLTAGDGTIGGLLKSSNYDPGKAGWAVYPGGSAEFGSTSIRGQLTAQQIDGTGLSIRRKNADGSFTTIIDSGLTVQEQINNYAVNATAGISLNFDPTCSNTTAWDSRNIATIADGLTGSKVLAGSNGEHLFEGITPNKAYTINYDPQKRYQLSALVRRTPNALNGDVHLGLLEVDKTNALRYDWGSYLATKIPVNSLTTIFKRYYAYFGPGDLHDGTAKVIVHAILGYPNTGNGRVEIQDIKLEDISQGHAVQYASTSTAAVDASNKSTAALNTAQNNMGVNSWVINRYPVPVPAGIVPDYTYFANVTPAQSVTFADTTSFDGNIIFGSNYDKYIGVATCNIYCDNPVTWNTQISGDDAHIIYVNGVSVTRSGGTRNNFSVTINFPKGWSTVEVVWADQTGSDGFSFNTKISSVNGISQMWAFVGGSSVTAGITASAATTSTWSGTTNIPYDKIISTDATTTLGFNPSFELWTGTYPANWENWAGTAPIKETENTKVRFGTNSVKYVANGESGLGMQHTASWSTGMPIGSFISGTIDIYLSVITSGLPGIRIRLFKNPELTSYVDTLVQPVNTIDTWQRIPFTARVGVSDQIFGVRVYLLASSGELNTGVFKGTVFFDGLTFAFFDNSIDNKAITIDNTTGTLVGTGAGDVVVSNQKITVSGTGTLTGIGSTNVVVDNTKITVDADTGRLVGAGSDTVVDNSKIVVGGTNLLYNSGNFLNIDAWQTNGTGAISLSSTILYGSKNTLQITGGSGGCVNTTVIRLKPSTQYIVSAIVKGTAPIADAWNNTLHIQNWTNEKGENLDLHQEVAGVHDTAVTTSWKQIYQTFTTPSSTNLVYCRFYFYPITNVQLNVAYVQLEQGNKITDWSPSPDEIGATIATLVKGSANDFLSNKAANIIPADGAFKIVTPDFDNTNGKGSGILISGKGITARKNGLPTFAISNDGSATFSGDLNIVSNATNRVEITTDRIQVISGGVTRVTVGRL